MKVIYQRTLPALFALVAAGCAPGDGGESEGTPQASRRDTTPTVIPDMTPTVIMETTMGRLVMDDRKARNRATLLETDGTADDA